MTQGIAGRIGQGSEKLREALARRGPGELAQEAADSALLLGSRSASAGSRLLVWTGTADVRAVLSGGEDALAGLRGSFALAMWDGESLLLARDAFGERPLAYVESATEFWFGPDAGVLRAAGAPVGSLDRAALSDYLELLCVPAPRSMWSAVRRLPAGHLLRLRGRRAEVRRFVEPLVPGSRAGAADGAAVKAALEASVREADPSALVLAASTSWGPLRALAPSVRTVAVGYAADDPALVALGEAERIVLDGATLAAAHDAAALSPEPAGDASAVALQAGFAAAGPGRVLVPHGGAPVFADAARYRAASRVPHSTRAGRVAALLQYVAPRKHVGRLSRVARTLSSTGGERVRALAEAFSPEDRKALLHSEARTAPLEGAQPGRDLDAAMAFDLDVLLPDRFLPALDQAAALAGAEVVAPFLDARVAALVIPLSSKEKLRGDGLLRSLFTGLPPEGRPVPPLRAWLSGPLRTQLDDLLRPPSARIRTFMDPRGIDFVLSRSLGATGDPRQAYALLMLERWARNR